MTSPQDLLAALRIAVGSRNLSYSTASASNDLYEGYLFGITIRAAGAAGAHVTYEDVDGTTVADLVFRTSPGMIYSRVNLYTHAVLEFADCPPLEVHVGVRVQGRSGVLHECDVLVVSRDEAELARARAVAPRGSRCLLAIECKFYASHLSLFLARGFHGLHTDLGVKFPFFVSNVRAARIERFLTYHKRSWENGVVPSSQEAVYLEGLLRDAFKKYQASSGVV